MKLTLIIVLVCFTGALCAETSTQTKENRDLVELLEKRAISILHQVRAVIREHRGQHEHLLQALVRQEESINALTLKLKTQFSNPNLDIQSHHLHTIEKELFYLENRVSEEMEIFNHIRSGNDRRGESAFQLVARGEQLLKDAQATVSSHLQVPEVKEIQSELIVVGALIKAVQAKQTLSSVELQKDEEELARQEHSLRQLIEKANGRKN